MQRPNYDYYSSPSEDNAAEDQRQQLAIQQELNNRTVAQDQADTTPVPFEEEGDSVSTSPPPQQQQQPTQSEEPDVPTFLEHIAIEARDWIDNKLEGDTRSKQQITSDYMGEKAQYQEFRSSNPATAILDEVTGIAEGASTKVVENIIGTGNLIGDTLKTRLGFVDESDDYNNVDLATYKGAEIDLQLREPTTQVGIVSRNILSFVGLSAGVRGAVGSTGVLTKIRGMSGASKWTARAGVETLVGFTADLINDPGDSNASNWLIDKFPGVENYIGMFAVEEDDSEWEKRFKSGVEGSIMQYGVDGLGLIFRATKAAAKPYLKWIRSSKGAKAADAPASVKAESKAILENSINKSLDDQADYAKKIKEYRQIELDLEGKNTTQLGLENAGFDGGIFDQRLKDDSSIKDVGLGDKPQVETALEELDTRGKGEFYHGTSTEIESLSSGMYEDQNIYGQGFYTTEDLSTAFKYTKKGKGKSPTAYKVTERQPVEFFDLDQPVSDDILRSLNDAAEYAPAVDEALGQFDDLSKVSTTELFDEIRGWSKSSGTSRHTIQEVFEGVQETLRNSGFGGWTHKGGLLTKSGREHQVRIYWDPENQLDISKVDSPKAKPIAPTKPKQPEGTRPGLEARMKEEAFNGTKGDIPSKYEPYERAGKSAEFPIEQVIKEQNDLKGQMKFDKRTASPAMTDATARQLSEAINDDATYRVVEQMYSDEAKKLLKKKLSSGDKETKEAALEALYNFSVDNPRVQELMESGNYGTEVNMSSLKKMVKAGVFTQEVINTTVGQSVVKTLIVDSAKQLSEIGSTYSQIIEKGLDGFRPATMMIDRMKALVRLQMDDATFAGNKLNSFFSIRNFTSKGAEARVKNKFEEMDALAKRLESGDPTAKKDLQVLADAFVLSDGDPQLATTFTEKFFEYGAKQFQTTLFNAYLSGIKTQERNLLGNSYNILFRPLEMALSVRGGSIKDRRAALSMYMSLKESLEEGMSVAKTSWSNFSADNTSRVDGGDIDLTMREKITNLRAQAKTPSQELAVNLLEVQYRFFAHPNLQGPMRGLNAADAGFKVVTARQITKFDVMNLAFEDGIKFDKSKFDTLVDTKIKDGKIVDERLMYYAKSDTFQDDLSKRMQAIATGLDAFPLLKFAVPFVKTPTNIIKRTGDYTPMLSRQAYKSSVADQMGKEWDEVMAGSDKVLQMSYGGREAAGILIGGSFINLGFHGLSTGAGPASIAGKKAWKLANIPQHSFRVGPFWVTNRILGPVGILMSLYSDLGLYFSEKEDYDGWQDHVSQVMATTAGAFLDQSWLKSVFGVTEYVSQLAQSTDQDREIFNIDKVTANIARGLIPNQAALRDFNNALMPGIREFNSNWEKLLAESVPLTKNALGVEAISMWTGEPMISQGWSALNVVQPFGIQELKEDPTLHKLLDLGVEFPSELTKTYKGVKLTVQQKNALHERIAATGYQKDIKTYLDSEYFQDAYENWEKSSTPRDKSEWYDDIIQIFSEAQTDAYNNYINGTSVEALELKNKVDNNYKLKYLEKNGMYEAADKLRNLIKLSE